MIALRDGVPAKDSRCLSWPDPVPHTDRPFLFPRPSYQRPPRGRGRVKAPTSSEGETRPSRTSSAFGRLLSRTFRRGTALARGPAKACPYGVGRAECRCWSEVVEYGEPVRPRSEKPPRPYRAPHACRACRVKSRLACATRSCRESAFHSMACSRESHPHLVPPRNEPRTMRSARTPSTEGERPCVPRPPRAAASPTRFPCHAS